VEQSLNKSRKVLVLLSIVALAAMISTYAFTALAQDTEEESTPELPECINEFGPGGGHGKGPSGGHGRGLGWGHFGYVEVSEEYEAKVISIAESDEDIQGLLNDGYTITGVRPILKTVVDSNGDVTTKATSAVVMLQNEDEMGHASAWVDIEEGLVSEIVIFNRTVIDKTS
jgi:hypothetical protein